MTNSILSTIEVTGGRFNAFRDLVIFTLVQKIIEHDIVKNGRFARIDEDENSVPGGFSAAIRADLERAWQAFARLGLGTILRQDELESMGEGEAADAFHSQHLPSIDRYFRAVLLPQPGEPIECPVFNKIYQNARDSTVYLMQCVVITIWQFFGCENFGAGDFESRDLFSLLASAGRRKIDCEVLSRLGVSPDAPPAIVEAQLREMEKRDTLEACFLDAMNQLLDLEELPMLIEQRPFLRDGRAYSDFSAAYPEVGNLHEMAKKRLQARLQGPGEGGLTPFEIRGVNRASLEVLYPQWERASRPARGTVAEVVRTALVNAFDAFAMWEYNKKQKVFGIVLKPGHPGQPVQLEIALDSLLARAGKYQARLLEVLYYSARKHKASPFFHVLRTDTARAQQFVDSIYTLVGTHELAHKAVLMLPDESGDDLSVPLQEREMQKEFSQQRWSQLVLKLVSDPQAPLTASVAAAKDVYKAVYDQNNEEDILTEFALELFCDRYGMYAERVDLELEAYISILSGALKQGTYHGRIPTTAQAMYQLEADALVAYIDLVPADHRELEQRLHDAVPGRSKIQPGDPAVNEKEFQVYQDILGRSQYRARLGQSYPADRAGMYTLRDAARAVYLAQQGLSQFEMSALAKELREAPQANIFVQAGDPVLTLEEEYFFRKFTEYAACLAVKGVGSQITRYHSGSPFVRVARSGESAFSVPVSTKDLKVGLHGDPSRRKMGSVQSLPRTERRGDNP